jgi:pectinesterase
MSFLIRLFSGIIYVCLTTGSIFAAEKADIIVAKDGTGDYTTIQAAINSISSSNSTNKTILVKNGTYNEHIGIDRSYISIIGESRDRTIITYSVERTAWTTTNGSAVGCAVLNIGCTSAFKKSSSTVTDIVIGNLTVQNTFDSTGVKTMVIKDEGNSTRIYVVNCNVWCKGHDTISLWTTATGMYYHADCSFKGSVDAVCPRGWCYTVGCVFYEINGNAPLWHEVASGTTQKFVIRTGKVLRDSSSTSSSFKLLNQNNSSSLGTRFYLLDCMISSKCTQEGSATEAYFYNCHGETTDQAWYANSLSSTLAQSSITAKWTFDNNWDPENTMPSALPFSALPQPWNGAYGLASGVTLKWIKGRNAAQNNVYFGTTNPPPFVQSQTTNTYTPSNLSSGTYYWRVDAINGTDTVAGSLWSFTNGAQVSVNNNKGKIVERKAFNVSQRNGTIIFNYTLDKSEIAVIRLFNIQGREMVSLPVVSQGDGLFTQYLQIKKYGLSKGKYIASMSLNEGSITKTAEITIH